MEEDRTEQGPIRLIACGVFRPAVEHLTARGRFKHVRVSYLPPSLHVRPDRLKAYFERAASDALGRGERIACLYGKCFPDIQEVCEQTSAVRVTGEHCYEMLLGTERFDRIMKQEAGTYFVEKDLILNFDEYCAGPLELHDEPTRSALFRNYRRLLYVQQPADPELSDRVAELAGFLGLELEIHSTDYSHLDRRLAELFQTMDRLPLRPNEWTAP